MSSLPVLPPRPPVGVVTTTRAGRRAPASHGRAVLSVATVAVAALALAGCSGSATDPDDATSAPSAGASATDSAGSADPTGEQDASGAPAPSGFDLPEGVSLTQPGSELSFGESATVAVEPNRSRGSALSLTVEEVQRGRTSDLSDFVLTDRARASTPYYVDVTVTNEGPGNIGGYAVPLYGQFDDTVLVENATFATPFERCPSTGLPRQFGPERSVERCLVYLVPDGGELQGVAFARAGDDPIAWSGSIAAPAGGGGNGGGGNGGNGNGGGGDDG